MNREVAQKMANDAGVDLVLIAPNAKPPVAKVIDFKKFLYQEEKKEKEAKKGIKKSGSKDISLSLFIGAAHLFWFIIKNLMEKNKQKTRKSAAKRFKLTARGKVLHRSQGFRHLRGRKSKRWLRRKKIMKSVEGRFKSKVKKMLGVK